MFNEKHDLIHELPEHREAIHNLKMTNNHFACLFEEYHEIRCIESEQEKQRLNLTDNSPLFIK